MSEAGPCIAAFLSLCGPLHAEARASQSKEAQEKAPTNAEDNGGDDAKVTNTEEKTQARETGNQAKSIDMEDAIITSRTCREKCEDAQES